METRHGMPVWAPTDAEMDVIRRRVSKERAKVAREIYASVRRWFASSDEHKTSSPTPGIKAPAYY